MEYASKLNPKWIKKTKKYFFSFMDETGFEEPVRNGKRGTEFHYPERLIMFIAVLAVKCKVKTYMGIHKMVCEYWDLINDNKNVSPISERQLRDRLKKICFKFRRPPVFIFQIFPEEYLY